MPSLKNFRFLIAVTGLLVIHAGLASCQKSSHIQPLFDLLSPDQTGIHFINTLQEGPGNNILETEFFYNGGGLAVGDVNNDGLPDLYFTANRGSNALYINRGNYQFEDVTSVAGVEDAEGWSAGVAMVDINADNLLDIYVCKAGKLDRGQRRNKLFINRGTEDAGGAPAFVERAREYKLDDSGYCTQPVFFDYNRDGLLDLFIVNYNTRHFSGFDLQKIRDQHDTDAGDRLYRNNGDGTFTDVSKESGIIQNPIGFGLSATVSDLNKDGRPDIYVTNDFIERDYMYINQGNGTFADEILSRTNVTSYFSMGSDIADINNDSEPDILTVDMLPPDRIRQKVFKTPNYDIYDRLVAGGYHRKNMRNALQLNQGNGTFIEVGQLAGVSMTDWSWASLIADFDNDGQKDIFISNGFPRFYTDLDYLNDVLWKQYPDENLPEDPDRVFDLVRQMKKVEMHNFAFQNKGSLLFEDVTNSWGLDQYAVSGASAYVDLNNDGALDLVVNNINEPPFIFRNHSPQQNDNNYLKVRLQGEGGNTFGTGAKVILTTADGSVFFQEAFQTRGFQTSVDPQLHFGLGTHSKTDIEIIWPDQSRQKIEGVDVNQTVSLNQQDASPSADLYKDNDHKMFALLNNEVLGFDFIHRDSFSKDRIQAPLMPHTLSNLGPALAKGDVNSDGLIDLFLGGGQDQAPVLYLQQSDGVFSRANVPVFDQHKHYEDTDAVFFDALGNGHLDLYVVSGGNFDPTNGPLYQDRLYLNDGFGNFAFSSDALPIMETSGGSVTLLDVEEDGDTDLFVGGRVVTGRYPMSPRSYLLQNNNGTFTDITRQASSELLNPGMVSDAAWADIDNDKLSDLIVTGEWMPIRIFKNNGDRTFREITAEAGLTKTSGWWNTLKVADMNGDGYPDLVAGNRGLNTSLNPTSDEPVTLYADDFDSNGSIDPLITEVDNGKRYPVAGRDLLLQQLSGFKNQFPDYASYASATIQEILSTRQIKEATAFQAHSFASAVFQNSGNGTFEAKSLPREAQAAPIYDMVIADFDADGIPDLLAAGNNFGTRPEMGPIAGQGILMSGDGKFNFMPVSANISGFAGVGDIRKIELIATPRGPMIILGRYNDPVAVFGYIPPQLLNTE